MKDFRRIAEDFAKRLKATHEGRIERIILFGSVARGDTREDSDIDVLVVTSDPSWEFRLALARETNEILLREGVYVSAKAMDPRELSEVAATSFGRNLRREGLQLA